MEMGPSTLAVSDAAGDGSDGDDNNVNNKNCPANVSQLNKVTQTSTMKLFTTSLTSKTEVTLQPVFLEFSNRENVNKNGSYFVYCVVQ